MIETKDLILDKARYEDWQAMYRNVWSRPQSFQYMVPELSPNEAEAQERMRRTIGFQAERKTAYTIFLKSTREAIGFAGIAQLEGNTWEETGICLGPDSDTELPFVPCQGAGRENLCLFFLEGERRLPGFGGEGRVQAVRPGAAYPPT